MVNQISTGGTAPDDAQRHQELDERLDAALLHLAATEPVLPPGRAAHHRETLMNQITGPAHTGTGHHQAPGGNESAHDAAPVTWWRRRLVLVGAVAATATLVAGPAAAAHMITWIHRAPATTQEADTMEIFYGGRSYTSTQINELQSHGKAMVTVEDPASYAKGQAHAFDTPDDADRWACANVSSLSHRPACTATRSTPGSTPRPYAS